jgi:putative glutamine amidotransferase
MTLRSRGPLIAVAGRPLAAGKISGWRNAAVGAPVAYVEAVHRAGGEEAILLPVELDEDEAARRLARFDGLLLLGGGDVHPSLYGQESAHARIMGLDAMSDAFEIPLARAATACGLPTLAVCRGLQVLNVALGGTLLQHIGNGDGTGPGGPGSTGGAEGAGGAAGERTDHGDPGKHRTLHDVRLAAGSRLAEILGAGAQRCTSEHHQAVDRLGDGLEPVGWAPDGIVEAVEHHLGWVVGVQWHPEVTAATDPCQQALFDALVRHAAGD